MAWPNGPYKNNKKKKKVASKLQVWTTTLELNYSENGGIGRLH